MEVDFDWMIALNILAKECAELTFRSLLLPMCTGCYWLPQPHGACHMKECYLLPTGTPRCTRWATIAKRIEEKERREEKVGSGHNRELGLMADSKSQRT